jgi:crotonobetainyl-CoA:carnitine CoA-transferase CaiB-like acyl-CoA transferase
MEPLSGLRVLDLTLARSGPTCARQFADWGADVVRVEVPVDPLAGPDRDSSDFQNLHRNTRSVIVDLKTDAGRAVIHKLAAASDVLIENMRPGVTARLGIDYETVRRINPRIVYGSLSGFGQDGPYAERGGVDQIVQGMGGLMSVTGLPGTEPTRVGVPIADLSAGLYLAIGVLVALHERGRTGEGRWVRTSLLEAMIAMLDLLATRWLIDGVEPIQEGNHHPTVVPMGMFRSSDGYVNIAGPAGRLFERFCEATGLTVLTQDPRFRDTEERSRHRAELNRQVANVLETRSTAEWIDILNRAGVPCGPVYSIQEMFDDPQVRHLDVTRRVEHPRLGSLELLRNAVNLGPEVESVRSPAPDAGEHTREVLTELGYTTAQIDELARCGAVSDRRR